MQFHSRAILLVATLLMAFVPNVTYAWGTFIVDPNCSWAFHTIQDAVNAATAYTDDSHADYIWISNDVTYTGQHIIINDAETEIIEGGFTDCNDYDPGTDHTTISGAGNDGGPVFQITGTGAAVVFSNLYITGAQRPGQNGGGIYFAGHGLLQLELTNVYLNEAGYGGGIYVTGSGGEATLYLEHDTTVLNNTAGVSGGGIRIEGTARLFALKPQTWIGFNHAMNGYGGGVEILGPARADIASNYNGGSVVSWNDARRSDSNATGAGNGGGIAVIDNGHGEGVLRTFADAAATPTAISSNTADYRGGGLYLSGAASACLFASSMVDDIAEDGAAIFQEYSSAAGAGIYVNGGAPASLGADCGPETVASLGGVEDCLPNDVACSTISNNTTQHSDGSPSAGSTVVTLGYFNGDRLRMRGNVAYRLMGHGNLDLTRCLLTDNSVSGPLLGTAAGGNLARIHSCTIANNAIDDAFVMEYWGWYTSVDLAYDIVDQPGRYVVNWESGNGATFDVSYIMARDIAGLPQNNPSVVIGYPLYVDAANGDYHLRPVAQLALDFGQGSNYDYARDLDGMPAPIDLAAAPNYLFGSADLGAYERQNFYTCGTVDSIFCDGFGP